MMIAVAFQVLESPGHSLTCSDDSLWHFLTIHFQRSTEVRFHPRSIDVRVHNLLSRADVEWFICPLLLPPWIHGLPALRLCPLGCRLPFAVSHYSRLRWNLSRQQRSRGVLSAMGIFQQLRQSCLACG